MQNNFERGVLVEISEELHRTLEKSAELIKTVREKDFLYEIYSDVVSIFLSWEYLDIPELGKMFNVKGVRDGSVFLQIYKCVYIGEVEDFLSYMTMVHVDMAQVYREIKMEIETMEVV